MKPLISIVVPVYNQAGVTVNCFNALRKNTKYPYELIWVDNGSKKDEFEIIRRQAKLSDNCKVIKNNKNLGFIKATNQGIKLASGEYIVLLNNDTEVFPGWDEELLFPLTKNLCSIVGPLTDSRLSWQNSIYVNDRWNTKIPKYSFCDKKTYMNKIKHYSKKYINITNENLILAFFCVAFNRNLIKDVGLLCEEFSIGLGDDDEYCARLRSLGHTLYLSLGAFVTHYHRTTFNAMGLGEESIRAYNRKILNKKISQYKTKTKR